MKLSPFLIISMMLLLSCQQKEKQAEPKLFTLLDSTMTGVNFTNQLTSTDEFNIYTYRNFYNGGGVGIADVNNDGLLDLYLTANMESNRLYINKGNFKFQDITEEAGVGGTRSWSTGVSIVDINADGWADIYVCNSGDVKGGNKENEFFINNGDGTFTDRAKEMGLADKGFSTHAAFFDYDNDGDLDIYLLNNSFTAIGSANLMKNQRPIRDDDGGDKLYRNDGGVFADVSAQAGIYGSYIGFGLGVSVTDLDKDGWMDLYISNDFFERDYIYMNNGDGTFREDLENQMRSISIASMGSDAADLNGDAYPDIFVTEMLPESEKRLKTMVHFETWDKYQYNIQNDYHHQFMRNMLHVHNGVSEGFDPSFKEVGRMANVEATDWSWGALIFDLNNDGFKDIFVSNGIYQDIINQDYLRYISNEKFMKMVVKDGTVDYNQLIDIIPSTAIPNYAFAGANDLIFENKSEDWGLAQPSHSNGSGYGDFDNDGDLDLVVSNVNAPIFIYQNNTDTLANYLKVVLTGDDKNKSAIGASVTLKAGDKTFYLEQSVTRGFQSSIDPRLNFGLGDIEIIDSLIVRWPGGSYKTLTNVSSNRTISLSESDGQNKKEASLSKPQTILKLVEGVIDFEHRENQYVDFDAESMRYHMNSTEGPYIARGDVNGDGLDDLYIGGARRQAGTLLIQKGNGFISTNTTLFLEDRFSEDGESLFFDVDGDGDSDLYVSSQGNDDNSQRYLPDRLYLNDGKGNFNRAKKAIPESLSFNTSTAKAADFDQDGDIDLFVGSRMLSGHYGLSSSSYILINDGAGIFEVAGELVAPGLKNIGMVTDAVWSDYDLDGDDDLVVIGEWMCPTFFQNTNGKFTNQSQNLGLVNLSGWWNAIASEDFNGDGFPDFVVGNHGLNSRFKCSADKPLECYVLDFDDNGDVEQIMTQYRGDKSYPVPLLHDLWKQMPGTKKKFFKYEDYQGKSIEEVFGADQLAEAHHLEAQTLASGILMSDGVGGFDFKPLGGSAQASPIYAILPEDVNKDGAVDLILGGNLFGVKPEAGRYDASYGSVLIGDAMGEFQETSFHTSGIYLSGEIRDFCKIRVGVKDMILVARNDDSVLTFELN
ncbi:MAG: FG-GAP-like repeat-containing protein [Cyclobacteriaceae bacterium]